MVIKRILLPFCDNGDIKPVAEAAFQIGRLISAQVRGFLVQRPYSFPPTVGEPISPEMIQLLVEHEQRTRAETFRRAQEMFQDFEARFPGVDAEWVAADGSIRDLVSHSARLADVSILGSGSQFEENGWGETGCRRRSRGSSAGWHPGGSSSAPWCLKRACGHRACARSAAPRDRAGRASSN